MLVAMKQGACPKCNGREIYEIDETLLSDHDSANGCYPLTLTAYYGETGEIGWFGSKIARRGVGIGAYVCASCAYSELYAKNLELLAEFARAGVGGVRKVTR
jgi:predicted nucleic-acid-binding Zn-ribbon protein